MDVLFIAAVCVSVTKWKSIGLVFYILCNAHEHSSGVNNQEG